MTDRRITADDVVNALLGPAHPQGQARVTDASSLAGTAPAGSGGMTNVMTGIGQMISGGEGGAPKAVAQATAQYQAVVSGAGPNFEPVFQHPRVSVQDEGSGSTWVDTFNFVGAGVSVGFVGATATITITGGGGGGGSTVIVQLNDGAAVAAADTLDFSTSFTITESPAGEANIGLDFSGGSGSSAKAARQDHTHNPIVFTEGAAPATPASGTVALYAKTDGRVYLKDDTGDEAPVYDDWNAIEVTISGGTGVIPTGVYTDIEVPYDCVVAGWTVLADQSGSIQIDLWKDTYANYPPVIGDTITGSDKPRIVSADKNQSTALTGWTTTLTRGDIIRVNIDSAALITRVLLSLQVRKT